MKKTQIILNEIIVVKGKENHENNFNNFLINIYSNIINNFLFLFFCEEIILQQFFTFKKLKK